MSGFIVAFNECQAVISLSVSRAALSGVELSVMEQSCLAGIGHFPLLCHKTI